MLNLGNSRTASMELLAQIDWIESLVQVALGLGSIAVLVSWDSQGCQKQHCHIQPGWRIGTPPRKVKRRERSIAGGV